MELASTEDEEIIASVYRQSGKPLKDREETVRVVKSLLEEQDRPALANVFGDGPLILSDIPENCCNDDVVLGIDEAGRGSLVGPMIYGCAYWSTSQADSIPKDFNDSKQLTEQKRFSLFDSILSTPAMGFGIRVLHASEIARNMLRPEPYNLNQMSHDAAISLIRQILLAGVTIRTCYIDTVGKAETYERRLVSEFPGIEFVVESKADANYAPCSAASVVAKVVRDRMIEHWKFSEVVEASKDFGSGYPSDPACKKWMENLGCNLFGYPDVVRFSWGPAKKALENAVSVSFPADEEDEDNHGGTKRQKDQMSIFLGKKTKRYPFFERRGLQAVTKLS